MTVVGYTTGPADGQLLRRAGVPPRAIGPHRRLTRSGALEIGGHLLAFDGWQIEREKGIFGHGGCGRFRCRGRKPFGTDFLLNLNDLRHVRHCNIGPR